MSNALKGCLCFVMTVAYFVAGGRALFAEPESQPTPPEVELALLRGKALFQDGAYAAAARYFKTANSLLPQGAEALVWLGKAIEAKDGTASNAIGAFEKATSIDPQNAEARWGVARAQLSRYGDLQAAKWTLNRLPENWQKSLRLGLLHARFAQFRSVAPDKRNTLHEAALTYYLDALKQKPDEAEIHQRLGQLYAAMGKTDQALEAFRQAVRLDLTGANEEGVSFAESLALFLSDSHRVEVPKWKPQRDLEEALQLLYEVRRTRPTFQSQLRLGRLLYYKPPEQLANSWLALEASIDAYERAKRPEDKAFAVAWMASTYWRLGAYDQALACWAHALELTPYDAGRAEAFGRDLFRRAHFREALAAFRWAEEFAEESRVDIWPGWVPLTQLVMGRVDEALKTLDARIQQGKNVETLRNYVGLAQLIKGQLDEAERELAQAKLNDDGRMARALTYARQGKVEQARKTGWRFQFLGLIVEPLAEGLIVLYAVPDSPGARAGLKPGDILLRAGTVSFRGWAQKYLELFQQAAPEGTLLEALVRSGDQEFSVTLKWDEGLRQLATR